MHSKSKKAQKQKTVFYLRTDLYAENLKAGGSVSHTLGVVNGFSRHGYAVLCASSAMHDLLKKSETKLFFPLFLSKFFSFLGFRINCLLSNFFFTAKCFRFLKNHKIIFIYQRYSLLNFTGIILARLKKVPLILEFNGSEVWIEKNWFGKKWIKALFLVRWIEKWNLNRARSIVVVSRALKDFLVTEGVSVEKILVNPNGVDPECFAPEKLKSKRISVRKFLEIEDKFVFGFVGTFSFWHGIETVAKMIPEVIHRCPHAHFLLIGSGPLLPYLKSELEKNKIGRNLVTLTGIVAQSDTKNYLAACDAFLSPTRANKDGSRFFGSPTKMFEYMSLAKPVIASDLEQLSDLLYPALKLDDLESENVDCKKKVGVLVVPDDVQGFVRAACRLSSMKTDACCEIGKNARKKVVNSYSWSIHTRNILEFVSKR